MSYLEDKCTFSILNIEILNSCQVFDCGHEDLNDFFASQTDNYSLELLGKTYCFRLDEDPRVIVCAFTVSNDSIKTNYLPNSRKKKLIKNVPRQKHFNSYPAVLIGRLGINKNFKRMGIGVELMTFIKSWFIEFSNKTGCRFVVVDSYNESIPLKYYKKNGFDFLLSTEEQEKKYLGYSDNKFTFSDYLNSISIISKLIKLIQSNPSLDTRLMYFDLILLSVNKIKK